MKPTQLTLPNGLVATVHAQRSRFVRDLLKNCVNRNEILPKPSAVFAVEIEIENEHLYLPIGLLLTRHKVWPLPYRRTLNTRCS